MIENLVIVESPAKAKTIEKFLGKNFHVVSSFGHIRDLAKKNLGIEIDNNFTPHYEVPKDKLKVVEELKKAAAQSKNIWLASDEDREGEAIAWHLAEVLGLDLSKTKRIVFHEITKDAISDAIASPRGLDMNLVNAQQARRILDRLVGFEISPVLWKKVQPSLSAGRVQSVAVRLIVEREREIISFRPESSFRVTGTFVSDKLNTEAKTLKAEAVKRFPAEDEALNFLKLCSEAEYKVDDISVKPGTRSPAPPFTTSTLQQEAYRKLGFSVSQTMTIAQRLYEAGKITYMRTDSTNLSKLALAKSREVIISAFGEKYSKTRQYKTRSKGAQEAHEAIRPAYIDVSEISGNQNEKKLYELIWKRTIASQMSDAIVEKTNVSISMSNSPVR
ncbi:MAG: type I DNA topoisomerase, partial [Bacteroidales bacterium]|nr:type I DNA topoisomerase [Bacteroidales bacterium]